MELDLRPDLELEKIEGDPVNNFVISINNIHRPKSREYEIRYFELMVKSKNGNISRKPVIYGLYSSGRKSINLKPYFDITFNYLINFEKSSINVDLSLDNSDFQIFKSISKLVQPGGKIIISVVSPEDLPLVNETFNYLDLGMPPESTYLGSLLYHCGCGSFYKDWLFREGGREGPPALQGEKVFNEFYRKKGLVETAKRIIKFIKIYRKQTRFKNGIIRSLEILKTLKVDDLILQKQVDKVIKNN
jgi:hypothetical protein